MLCRESAGRPQHQGVGTSKVICKKMYLQSVGRPWWRHLASGHKTCTTCWARLSKVLSGGKPNPYVLSPPCSSVVWTLRISPQSLLLPDAIQSTSLGISSYAFQATHKSWWGFLLSTLQVAAKPAPMFCWGFPVCTPFEWSQNLHQWSVGASLFVRLLSGHKTCTSDLLGLPCLYAFRVVTKPAPVICWGFPVCTPFEWSQNLHNWSVGASLFVRLLSGHKTCTSDLLGIPC